MNRWFWIYPILAVLLSLIALLYWGASWTTVGLIALFVVCPAVMIWGAAQIHKTPVNDLKKDVKQHGGKRS